MYRELGGVPVCLGMIEAACCTIASRGAGNALWEAIEGLGAELSLRFIFYMCRARGSPGKASLEVLAPPLLRGCCTIENEKQFSIGDIQCRNKLKETSTGRITNSGKMPVSWLPEFGTSRY